MLHQPRFAWTENASRIKKARAVQVIQCSTSGYLLEMMLHGRRNLVEVLQRCIIPVAPAALEKRVYELHRSRVQTPPNPRVLQNPNLNGECTKKLIANVEKQNRSSLVASKCYKENSVSGATRCLRYGDSSCFRARRQSKSRRRRRRVRV